MTEKICPLMSRTVMQVYYPKFFKVNCVKEECMFWVKNVELKDNTIRPLNECSYVINALKGL